MWDKTRWCGREECRCGDVLWWPAKSNYHVGYVCTQYSTQGVRQTKLEIQSSEDMSFVFWMYTYVHICRLGYLIHIFHCTYITLRKVRHSLSFWYDKKRLKLLNNWNVPCELYISIYTYRGSWPSLTITYGASALGHELSQWGVDIFRNISPRLQLWIIYLVPKDTFGLVLRQNLQVWRQKTKITCKKVHCGRWWLIIFF